MPAITIGSDFDGSQRSRRRRRSCRRSSRTGSSSTARISGTTPPGCPSARSSSSTQTTRPSVSCSTRASASRCSAGEAAPRSPSSSSRPRWPGSRSSAPCCPAATRPRPAHPSTTTTHLSRAAQHREDRRRRRHLVMTELACWGTWLEFRHVVAATRNADGRGQHEPGGTDPRDRVPLGAGRAREGSRLQSSYKTMPANQVPAGKKHCWCLLHVVAASRITPDVHRRWRPQPAGKGQRSGCRWVQVGSTNDRTFQSSYKTMVASEVPAGKKHLLVLLTLPHGRAVLG